MNWSDVAKAISTYAPMAATALSSPVGAVAGVGAIIAKILNTDSDPAAVMEAIVSDPKRAEERITQDRDYSKELEQRTLEVFKERNRSIEAKLELANEEKRIINDDAKNARGNLSVILQSKPMIALMFIVILGTLSMIFGCIFILYSRNVSQEETALASTIIGFILGSWRDVTKLFFPESGR